MKISHTKITKLLKLAEQSVKTYKPEKSEKVLTLIVSLKYLFKQCRAKKIDTGTGKVSVLDWVLDTRHTKSFLTDPNNETDNRFYLNKYLFRPDRFSRLEQVIDSVIKEAGVCSMDFVLDKLLFCLIALILLLSIAIQCTVSDIDSIEDTLLKVLLYQYDRAIDNIELKV